MNYTEAYIIGAAARPRAPIGFLATVLGIPGAITGALALAKLLGASEQAIPQDIFWPCVVIFVLDVLLVHKVGRAWQKRQREKLYREQMEFQERYEADYRQRHQSTQLAQRREPPMISYRPPSGRSQRIEPTF